MQGDIFNLLYALNNSKQKSNHGNQKSKLQYIQIWSPSVCYNIDSYRNLKISKQNQHTHVNWHSTYVTQVNNKGLNGLW